MDQCDCRAQQHKSVTMYFDDEYLMDLFPDNWIKHEERAVVNTETFKSSDISEFTDDNCTSSMEPTPNCVKLLNSAADTVLKEDLSEIAGMLCYQQSENNLLPILSDDQQSQDFLPAPLPVLSTDIINDCINSEIVHDSDSQTGHKPFLTWSQTMHDPFMTTKHYVFDPEMTRSQILNDQFITENQAMCDPMVSGSQTDLQPQQISSQCTAIDESVSSINDGLQTPSQSIDPNTPILCVLNTCQASDFGTVLNDTMYQSTSLATKTSECPMQRPNSTENIQDAGSGFSGKSNKTFFPRGRVVDFNI